MDNIIEDQIIQYESLGYNNGFLVDEKEANLNSNTELYNNASNDFPLFSKSDLFSEKIIPTYMDKSEKKNLTETTKILNENQNNNIYENIDLTSVFFPKRNFWEKPCAKRCRK